MKLFIKKVRKFSNQKIEKKKNKKSGYLLVEILISLFIFSVLVLVVSVFLKRVVLIEKAKKNNQKMYENMYFSMDKIIMDIKNRDIQDFLYENKSNNIFIKENKIIAAEIMPGLMPKIIKKLSQETHIPIITGGLIKEKEDVINAINAGALSVSTTEMKLWED